MIDLIGGGPVLGASDDGRRYYVIVTSSREVLAGPMAMTDAVREVKGRIEIGGAPSMEITEINYGQAVYRVGDRIHRLGD